MKPRDNPDFVKYQNDSKQKRLTAATLRNRIESMKRRIKHDEAWVERVREMLQESRAKLAELERQLFCFHARAQRE